MRAAPLRVYRATVLVMMVVALRGTPDRTSHSGPPATVDEVASHLEGAARLESRPDGGFTVLRADGEPLGLAIRTSPESDQVIGFSGPSDVLLVFDAEDRVVHARLITSGDTDDHVRAVVDDGGFWDALKGRTREELVAPQDPIDAVSGATLTSLAILEGIARRVSGARPSLRFPDPVSVDEVRRHLPDAASLVPDERRPWRLTIRDRHGNAIGTAARTSPYGDHVIGYQGPTDVLLVNGGADGVAIRRSYDNPRYVGYVVDDPGFLVSAATGEGASVEGVSGATMTSLAIIEAIAALPDETAPSAMPAPAGWVPKGRDVGTAAVVFLGLWFAFSRGHRPRLRLAFQVGVISYLGFVNGDLVSQSLVLGWAEHGVPVETASGLACLVAAALLVPLLTGRQVYCQTLCPHGHAQRFIRRRFRGRVRVRGRTARTLARIPGVLLVGVIGLALFEVPVNLASVEAFDAYVVQHAGWATFCIAGLGLVASVWAPMAYCRFGCPTGALLGFLRTGGTRDRFTMRDGAAAVCVAVAFIVN